MFRLVKQMKERKDVAGAIQVKDKAWEHLGLEKQDTSENWKKYFQELTPSIKGKETAYCGINTGAQHEAMERQ